MQEAAVDIPGDTQVGFHGRSPTQAEEPAGGQLSLIQVRKKNPAKRRVAVKDIILRGPAPDAGWLVESIQRVGLLHDPILLAVPGGRYEVLGGRRRMWAVRSLEWETVNAKIYEEGDLSDVERLGILLTENAVRSDNPMAELQAIEALLESNFTVKGIAKSLGKRASWVRTRLALRKLSPELRKALESGRLTLGAALKAAKLSGEEQASLAEKSREEGLGRISLEAVEEMKRREPAAVPLRMFAVDPKKATDPLERLGRIKDDLRDLLKSFERDGRKEAADRAREAYECLGRLRMALEGKEGKD